ncbi:hypothetical protein [Psychrobacillus sp. NPDC093180]
MKANFKDSQEAYAYYTYDLNGEAFNRVVTIKGKTMAGMKRLSI